MKMLLLAEKPSVARAIASVIKRGNFPDQIDVDSFHGHLMRLADPDFYNPDYKNWSAKDLPILIDDFKYVEDDKKRCGEIMRRIRDGRYDYLVNACDAGREGDLIFYSFYWAHGLTIPVLRLWSSSATDKALEAALKNLMPASNFYGYTQSAMYRQRFDWLLGINFSRAASLAMDARINIGSVMTPTLAMVVNREKAIRDFVPETYWEVITTFQAASGETYTGIYMATPKSSRLGKEADAKAVEQRVSSAKEGVIHSLQTKRETIKAPTLYSLLELQKDASKYFGYKAGKTLELAQALYEKHKLITYPRSECRFLPTDMVPEIMDHIEPLYEIPELVKYAKGLKYQHIMDVLKGKDYVDDAKLTDHHAIIPTNEKPYLTNLSKDERNVYLLVCKRFLSIFLPPYVVDKTVMVTDVNGDLFKSTGKVEVNKGFGILYASHNKDAVLPKLAEGDKVGIKKVEVEDAQTTPPKRYTTQSLLDAMQNAGNTISEASLRRVMRESAGLGTSATRASILEKLEKLKYLRVEKSTFYPTDFGIQIIEALNGRAVCSAELRARWELDFKQMEESNKVPDQFQAKIDDFVATETKDMLVNLKKHDLSQFRSNVVGTCPICGGKVLRTKSFYLCENYKNPCTFLIPPDVMGAMITEDDAKALLGPSHSTTQKTLTTKAGNKLYVPLVLNEGKVKPAFAVSPEVDQNGNIKKPPNIVGTCPACGGDVYETARFYTCGNRSDGCQFLISKSILGAVITSDDAKRLLSGKATTYKTFQWKSGKFGKAKLRLNGTKLDFDF